MIRYVMPRSMEYEATARKAYLYDTFHLSFLERSGDPDFIELVSFPFVKRQYLFLCGHNGQVIDYLKRHRYDLTEEIKVITSCTPRAILECLPWLKNVYFCKTNWRGYAFLRYGAAFGFDFDITDSELDLYNAKGCNLLERIQSSYRKMR